jgi:hypothetical protein
MGDPEVWIVQISHWAIDLGDTIVTAHDSRSGADKEVECTAHALGIGWPEGMLDVPDEAELGDVYATEGWMVYKITQTKLQH